MCQANALWPLFKLILVTHHHEITTSAMMSQITGIWTVCSLVCSGAHQRNHQSSVLLTFVRGIHQWLVDSPHKGPVTRKMFPFDYIIMIRSGTALQHLVPVGLLWHVYMMKWKCFLHYRPSVRRIMTLCEGTPPVTGGFPLQRTTIEKLWLLDCTKPLPVPMLSYHLLYSLILNRYLFHGKS